MQFQYEDCFAWYEELHEKNETIVRLYIGKTSSLYWDGPLQIEPSWTIHHENTQRPSIQ